MKATILQLRVYQKWANKGNHSIMEFVVRIKVIANSLLVIGDSISEQDQIDFILDGLPKEYNPFVMKMYGIILSPTLYDVK